jgi:hypothetical protein
MFEIIFHILKRGRLIFPEILRLVTLKNYAAILVDAILVDAILVEAILVEAMLIERWWFNPLISEKFNSIVFIFSP